MTMSFTPVRYRLTTLRNSTAYDVVMRLPMLVWSVGLGFALMLELQHYSRAAVPETPSAIYFLNIAMRLSMIAYLVILAATVASRTRPLHRARGAEPPITALLGSFLITAVVLFPRRELSASLGCISTFLVLAGDLIATVVLIQLRGSFSIMAEARQLTTSGACRIIRHPLYLAEEVATIGCVIQFLSIWTGLLLLLQIACQIRRMSNEETVLTDFFPEYTDYKRTTARVIPGLY